MTVSAHDVARELRGRLDNLGTVKLHKLLYYAQGWHLVLAREPLFDEPIEAWANGPVVQPLWSAEKYADDPPPASEVTLRMRATIDYVVQRYGHLTGKELIRLTHAEDPWRDASESDDPFEFSSPPISTAALEAWFEKDDDFIEHSQAAKRHLAREDIYSFDAHPLDANTRDAVDRALEGVTVRHARGE